MRASQSGKTLPNTTTRLQKEKGSSTQTGRGTGLATEHGEMTFAMGKIGTPIVELPVQDESQAVEWI